MVLAWTAGSYEIGDFTWPGFDGDAVATRDVFEALSRFDGFEPGPIEMVEDTDSRQRGKRVRLPYEGPDLHDLWVTASVAMDSERSSAELESRCTECDSERWELYGVERWNSWFDQDLKRLVRVKTERLPEAGIYVEEVGLAGAAIFRVREFPGWIFCTDEVRRVIEEHRFTNVSFLEMGDTF